MKTSKNATILVLLSVFLFFGCSQDNLVEQLEEEQALTISTINDTGDIINTKVVTNLPTYYPLAEQKGNNPNQGANGNYTIEASGNRYVFSATDNRGGVHGQTNFNRADVGRVHGTTICVTTNDDGEAVVAYLVTSVEFPNNIFFENAILFFKYKDNGEGANSPPDASSGFIIIYFNWFDFYETADDFLVDVNCSNNFNNPSFGAYGDRSGEIQVR